MTMTRFHRALRLATGALLVVLLAAPAAWAQEATPRIGYTDYELIIVQMPQYREVQQQLQQQAQTDQQALAQMEQNIQEKFADYQNNQAVLSAEARQSREQEIVQLQTDLQREQQQRLQALGRREAELLQPLLDRLQDAIDRVASSKGLWLVLSSRVGSEPAILYAGPNTADITAEVMSELGISMSQTGNGN